MLPDTEPADADTVRNREEADELISSAVASFMRKHRLARNFVDELTVEAKSAHWIASRKLGPHVNNVKGYLWTAIKNALLEYLQKNWVITRKGQPRIDGESNVKTDGAPFSLDEIPAKEKRRKCDLQDIYDLCGNDWTDRLIISVCYDNGAGARRPAEVAKEIGRSIEEVQRRIEKIEIRANAIVGLRKPKVRRRYAKRGPQPTVEASTARSDHKLDTASEHQPTIAN